MKKATWYLSRIRGMGERHLIDVGAQVEQTISTPGYGVLVELLRERKEALVQQMANGSVLEHTKYAQLSGMISAIDEALLLGETIQAEAVVAGADDKENT